MAEEIVKRGQTGYDDAATVLIDGEAGEVVVEGNYQQQGQLTGQSGSGPQRLRSSR